MSALTAGVDLGGTKIQTVVVRGTKVVGSDRVPTPHTGAGDVIAAIVGTVRDALAAADAEAADLGGIGIGSPGAIDAAHGIVSESPNVPGFQDKVALGPDVSKAFGGIPVALDNDVRVAMLGEHAAGRRAAVPQRDRRVRRHRGGRGARARRQAPRWARGGRRDRPHVRPAEGPPMLVRTSRAPGVVRGTRSHGGAGPAAASPRARRRSCSTSWRRRASHGSRAA